MCVAPCCLPFWQIFGPLILWVLYEYRERWGNSLSFVLNVLGWNHSPFHKKECLDQSEAKEDSKVSEHGDSKICCPKCSPIDKALGKVTKAG
mmetsp:Transcript_22053/g.34584  ORF Transcript_22053/g.34584 Transcript_22053/m.34584 type:complete len:92 (-) Transcript_22053:144-419(-)